MISGKKVIQCVPIHKLSEINFHFSKCFNTHAWMWNPATGSFNARNK